jgi:hypothetical protein
MGGPFLGRGLGVLASLCPTQTKTYFWKRMPQDEDLFLKFLDLDNKSMMWQKYSKIPKLFLFTGCQL